MTPIRALYRHEVRRTVRSNHVRHQFASNPSSAGLPRIRTTRSGADGPGLHTSQRRRRQHHTLLIARPEYHPVLLPCCDDSGCTTEACDFRDNLARLSSRGFTVLGISKDPMDRLVRFRERDHLTFPLLSDADLTVHRLYGAYGEKKLYGKVYEGVIRSTFVIDGDGVIRVARYNVRAKGHVDSLLRALDKLDGSVF